MSAMLDNAPVYSKAVKEEIKGNQLDLRIDLTAIQFFNTEQWENWITDRLQGRDIVLPLDPRQGEEPEFLFIDLIPRLGKARETAECAIEDVLNRALAERWEDAPLAALFYLIEKLRITNCAPAIQRYLDAPYKMNPAPYGRALSAMAEFCRECPVSFEEWQAWTEYDQDNLLPGCVADLIGNQPAIAIRLLDNVKWADWQNSTLVEALLDELEIYFLAKAPEQPVIARLCGIAQKNRDFREAVFSILPKGEDVNGWSRNLFNISCPITLLHTSKINDGKSMGEKSKRLPSSSLSLGVKR